MATAPSDLLYKDLGGCVVIKKTDKHDSHGSVIWLVQCKLCNSVKERSAIKINEQRYNKSCGCRGRDREVRSIPGHSGTNRKYRGYICGAQLRNLAFELSFEYFRDICLKDCHYCGLPASQGTTTYGSRGKRKEYGKFISNGIDRKDNNIGYIKENCLPCCELCNKAKKDLSYEAFLSWIYRLKNHLTK